MGQSDYDRQFVNNHMVAQYCNTVQSRKTRHSTKIATCNDNEAVVKICAKGRSRTLHHLPRTHKIAIDWFYEFCKLSYVKLVNVTSDVARHFLA